MQHCSSARFANLLRLAQACVLGALLVSLASISPSALAADDQGSDPRQARSIKVANGKVTLPVTADWESVEPRVNIIEHEFRIPRVGDDGADGRLTIMTAGGGVQANIDRWLGQFKPGGGQRPQNEAQPAQEVVEEVSIHWVDIRGTYLDRRGPFAPATERPNYRLLGAVLGVPGAGEVYVKFYGPAATLEEHEGAFQKMIKGLNLD